MKEKPRCYHDHEFPEMEYICDTGIDIRELDSDMNIIGVHTEKLYQCKICKTIKAL